MKKKKIKIVKAGFKNWWSVFNPWAWIEKNNIEKKLNDEILKQMPKIREHVINEIMHGKCNGDCGLLTSHPELKTANPPHNSQEPAKPSAGGQSQAKQ